MTWLDESSGTRRLKLYWFSILVVALGAFALRAPRLSLRPMHTDEAVHADNFRRLLEGSYGYDPHEYHGPTLNYFTRIPAWLSGAKNYIEINEATLRIVPVVFGTILVLLTVFLVDGLGLGALLAAALTALSPAMVFYSRYYIQEMLLVCFTFGVIVCGYRYARSRALPWAVAAGVFAGLMHATKETCILAFASMGLALGLMTLAALWEGRSLRQTPAAVRPLHFMPSLVTAVVVSALFYSLFFHRFAGVVDSYRAYTTYLGRGAGANTTHVHPWYYYLQIITFVRYFHGPVWTEGGIVLLALVGLPVAFRKERVGLIDPKLVRFLALYTIVLTVVYSAIPYKTPWCLLSFLHGMILLAGVGAARLLAWAKRPMRRAAVGLLLVLIAGHLIVETYRANFVYYADSRNPYVYAHPTTEIFTIVDKVKEYVGVLGLGQSDAVPIQVAAPGKDYWPLPWYLRAYHVGWYTDIPAEVGPLILISDQLEPALTQRLYVDTPDEKRHMYLCLFDPPYYMWFRPGVKMLGFVRKALWDEHANQPPAPTEAREGNHGQSGPTTPDTVRGR